jgi:hypothetical protein
VTVVPTVVVPLRISVVSLVILSVVDAPVSSLTAVITGAAMLVSIM